MDRIQQDWQHQYLVTPWEYPISDNEAHSTYDQFIQLRDTLIFTGKYYNDKASKKLCVGDKWDWTTTNTIEVWLPNIFKQSFQPTWRTDENTPWILWSYITSPDWTVPQELLQQVWPLCCQIQKDWWYRIIHKEEVLPTATTEKVFCYVDIYRKNDQWIWEIPYKWWVAVFDWQWSWTLSWTTSWTEPSGSCSIQFKLWQLLQKMTAFGYMERNLKKWDLLVLRMKDWPHDPTTWEPTWNDLVIQNDSNYRSIEYLDLPYNI